ncbi:MAG TPA: hypothetical protein VFG10_08160 [Saprospiraceae bacterium]|nr:hypothetical protein [Saprospiraceae bacterium]
MHPSLKSFLFSLFFAGLLFATAMLAFDLYDGKSFDLWKFLFRFVLFGLGMALIRTFTKKDKAVNE